MCATNCIVLAYITIVFRSLNDDYHIQNVHVCKFDFVTGELDNLGYETQRKHVRR